mgnify:CR=1 FL=1
MPACPPSPHRHLSLFYSESCREQPSPDRVPFPPQAGFSTAHLRVTVPYTASSQRIEDIETVAVTDIVTYMSDKHPVAHHTANSECTATA